MAPSGGNPARFLSCADKSEPPVDPSTGPEDPPTDPPVLPCFCAWHAAASAQLATATTRGSGSWNASRDNSCSISNASETVSDTGVSSRTHTCHTMGCTAAREAAALLFAHASPGAPEPLETSQTCHFFTNTAQVKVNEVIPRHISSHDKGFDQKVC